MQPLYHHAAYWYRPVVFPYSVHIIVDLWRFLINLIYAQHARSGIFFSEKRQRIVFLLLMIEFCSSHFAQLMIRCSCSGRPRTALKFKIKKFDNIDIRGPVWILCRNFLWKNTVWIGCVYRHRFGFMLTIVRIYKLFYLLTFSRSFGIGVVHMPHTWTTFPPDVTVCNISRPPL